MHAINTGLNVTDEVTEDKPPTSLLSKLHRKWRLESKRPRSVEEVRMHICVVAHSLDRAHSVDRARSRERAHTVHRAHRIERAHTGEREHNGDRAHPGERAHPVNEPTR